MKRIKPVYLPWGAALVQTLQYAHAGHTYLGPVGIFIVGAMGALMSVVVAYSAARLNDIAAGRRLSAWLFFVLLLGVSPIFVGVAMYEVLGILGDSPARWIVAALWGLIPDGSVALSGFVTGKSLVDLRTSGKKTGTSRGKTGTSKKTSKQSANEKRRAAMLEIVECPYCPETMTRAKLNNHAKKCKETNVFTMAESNER